MDLRPVVVGRIQDVGSGNCDVVVDAGYCDVVSVVLAGRYRIGLSYDCRASSSQQILSRNHYSDEEVH